MNEHYFQKKIKQYTSIVGYLIGVAIAIFSIIKLFSDFDNWIQYATIGTLGLILSYLADIIMSSNARTELLMRIMKRQEVLFRKINQSQNQPSIPDPLNLIKNLFGNKGDNKNDGSSIKGMSITLNEDGKVKIKGEEPPEELLNILQKVTGAMKEAFEAQQGKAITEMSIDELKEQLDKSIKQEDYTTAGMLRDEIKKREDNNNPSSPSQDS